MRRVAPRDVAAVYAAQTSMLAAQDEPSCLEDHRVGCILAPDDHPGPCDLGWRVCTEPRCDRAHEGRHEHPVGQRVVTR